MCEFWEGSDGTLTFFQIPLDWMQDEMFFSVMIIIFTGFMASFPLCGETMKALTVELNGREVSLAAQKRAGEILVPLDGFCDLIGAEAKEIDGGPFAVCRGDLCIPLNVSDTRDTIMVDGVLFGRLDAFGGPLDLEWHLDNGTLSIQSKKDSTVGLGAGDQPPPFTLSDLYTGQSVSLSDFQGKKTAFYMWASW